MIKKMFSFLFLFSFMFALNIEKQCGYLPSEVKAPYFPKITLNIQNIPFSFKCPTLYQLAKNPKYFSIIKPFLINNNIENLKNLNVTVYLDNVNFITGSYTCIYNYKGKSFNINLKNKTCLKFNINFKKIFPPSKVNSVAKLNVPNVITNKVGFYKFEKPISFKQIYETLYNQLLNVVVQLQKIIVGENVPILDLKKLDSHSNYDKTIPAFLINLLTLSPDYSNNGELIDGFGNLIMNFPKEAFQNMKYLVNLTNQNSMKETQFKDAKEISDFVQNKNKLFNEKFWGFYYIFFRNIEDGFNKIISIIFLFGAFGLFGFALMQKKFDLYLIEESQKFQFDFSKKFLSLAIPYILFTSPIITSSNAKVPSQFLYEPQTNNNINVYTPIQAGIRYSLNFGNYFGNLINDYGTYAYLYYLSNTVGYNLNPQLLLTKLNKDFSDFYYKFYRLKQKYDFYRTLCILSYPNTFQKYGHFPNNINPYSFDNSSIFMQGSTQNNLFNLLGFGQVKYNYCVFIEKDIYQRSIDLINSLNNYKDNYIKESINIQKRISEFTLKGMTNFLKTYISIHNTFGWLTSSVIPSLETVLKATNFISSINVSELRKKINEEVIKYSDFTYKQNGTSKEDYKTDDENSIMQQVLQWIGKYSMYTVLPGFNDLMTNIYKFINNSSQNEISKIISRLENFSFPTKILMKFLPGVFIFIMSFLFAVFLYNLIVSILTFLLIAFTLIIKIAFYYLEVFVTFLISFALSIWALTTNPQRAWDAWSNFMFHIAKLTFMPIIIVLTSFSIILLNKIIKFIYAFVIYIIGTILNSSISLSVSDLYNLNILNTGGSYLVINSFVGGTSGIILDILILIIDLIVIFKFSDWVFEIFGKRDVGGTFSNEVRQIGEGLKSKYSGGML